MLSAHTRTMSAMTPTMRRVARTTANSRTKDKPPSGSGKGMELGDPGVSGTARRPFFSAAFPSSSLAVDRVDLAHEQQDILVQHAAIRVCIVTQQRALQHVNI